MAVYRFRFRNFGLRVWHILPASERYWASPSGEDGARTQTPGFSRKRLAICLRSPKVTLKALAPLEAGATQAWLGLGFVERLGASASWGGFP